MSNAPRSRAEARRRSEAQRRPSRKARRRSWPRRILYTLIGLFVLGVAGLGIAYALTDVPKPNDLAVAQTNVIYYADGKTEIGRVSEQNRENVPLKQIPLHVQQAMLAAEDRNFYENSGISPTGIARAVWVAIKGGEATQGGSTITQQYVKNYFLSQDRTLSRKAREILISVKIDGQQSKDQILENYFNTIYYGRGAYGIQTASKAYFGKDVSKLTPAEGAFLASVIRGPSFYDPRLGAEQEENARTRSGYILDAMVSQGWLTPEQRAGASFPTDKDFVTYKAPTATGTSGYVMELVKTELAKKVKISEADFAKGGLRIVTTIDKKKQDAAEEAVKERIPEDAKDLHVGLASIKPGDGAVQALYGGADYAQRQQNTATQDTMQAGSTFKVFALIAALQSKDVSIRNTFDGSSPQYFDEFEDSGAESDFNQSGGVRNFNNNDFGRISVATATANSVNTVFAKLNVIAGPKNTAAAAKQAGVTTELETNYANVLGTDNVKVIDMANAYATLAAKGVKATPYYVKSVKATDGSFDYTAKPQTSRAFPADLVSDVVYCMEQVIERGSGDYAGERLDRQAAGKTGTSSDNYSAWFDGFTPQLATAIGMYKGDGTVTKPDGTPNEENQMDDVPGWGAITGGTIPVRIWTDFMRSATDGMEKLEFPEPAYVNTNDAGQRTQRPENNDDNGNNNGNNNGDDNGDDNNNNDGDNGGDNGPRPTNSGPSTSSKPTRTTKPTPPTTPSTTPKPSNTPRPTTPRPTISIPLPPGPGGERDRNG